MRILFVSGAGIRPEQRVHRWRMVSELYGAFGAALRGLGHDTYYYVHPDAWHDNLKPSLTWLQADHGHFAYVLETFQPDFVFCWNGASPGDLVTSTMAAAANAKMVYSEQGWFPQNATLYFDFAGTNARCGTRNKAFPTLTPERRERFLAARAGYMDAVGAASLFDPAAFETAAPDISRPVFVPLQDERDLNIAQDSPFRTMHAFVSHLTAAWPDAEFRVRPHPKYPDPELPTHARVTVDSPKTPMFESLAACGLVVGINSTTLLESALLGKPVVSFGESLATGTGLFRDVRPGDDVRPEEAGVDSDAAAAVLAALLEKQFFRKDLGRPVRVLTSSIFTEMRTLMSQKPLQAWI